MKYPLFLLVISMFFLTGCFLSNQIELIPGEIIADGGWTYYQEYNAGLGNKAIEGIIKLPAGLDRLNEEGVPVAGLTIDIKESVFDEELSKWVDQPIPGWPADNQIAFNVETGYYKVEGLPEIRPKNRINITVDDMHWSNPPHVRYTIRKTFSAKDWNALTEPFSLASASYFLVDPSISATVNFTYCVDKYWLENGEFEDESVGASYEEMTYNQLASIASFSVQDWVSGVGYSKTYSNENGFIDYSVGTHLNLSNYEDQAVTFTGFAVMPLESVGGYIIVNDQAFGGSTSLSENYQVHSGDSIFASISFYIPQRE